MNDCTSIKQLVQRLMPRQNEIVIGKVVRSNPLHVQILNDDKLILSKGLVIPVRILAENLVVGEYVHILTFNNGKKYYVLDKAVI